MATRTDRVMSAALRAAKQAKQWATVAAREADRLLQDAKKRAITIERRRQLKKRLLQTARVMKAAGRAAVRNLLALRPGSRPSMRSVAADN